MKDAPKSVDRQHHGSSLLSIFWISTLGLYFELLLIRWIGTEIRIFAYLQNTVLVVCFLGLGIGCFTAREAISVRQIVVMTLLLVALLTIPQSRKGLASASDLLSTLGDINMWGFTMTEGPVQTTFAVVLGLLITFFVMLLIVQALIPIGRLLGRLMDDHPRTISAYSANVAGSLAGTWLFVSIGFLSQPPVVWFSVLVLIMIPFFTRFRLAGRLDACMLAAVVILSALGVNKEGSLQTVWSPYQKLSLIDQRNTGENGNGPTDRVRVSAAHPYLIEVNNAGYQVIADLRPENVAAQPEVFAPEQAGLSQYDIPSLLHPNPARMLIVGSGSGNDVAGALRHGVEHITAVEIDPAIIEIGREYHPEQPYGSDRVHVVTDDARSFFATTDQKYDVIVFGLLDSHTTTVMTNARLDHYVYTRESLEHARDLLTDGGMICLTFAIQRAFIADRIGVQLRELFDQEPIVFQADANAYGWGGAIFVAGDVETAKSRINGNERFARLVAQWRSELPLPFTWSTTVTTDDWPYIYLEKPTLPPLYLLLAGLTLILVVYLQRVAKVQAPLDVRRWRRSDWHFAFLGAAFLLLEVQNISKSYVVLGSTWMVNAVIISGVLAMILLANLIAAKWPAIPLTPVYVLLCGTALGLYFLDLAQFAFLPYALKAVIVGGLTTLPMLFSGIVFIKVFAITPSKHVALGANLIGALAGAMLQSLSFLFGIKALLLLVFGFYVLAMMTKPVARIAASADRSPSTSIITE
jgi:hypothetical protein